MKTIYYHGTVYTGALPLGQDPFAADPSQLHAIPVQAAYLGGRPVYTA